MCFSRLPPALCSGVHSLPRVPSLAQCAGGAVIMSTGPALGVQSGSRQTFNSQIQEKAVPGTLSMAGFSSGVSPLCQALGVPDLIEFPEFSQGQVLGHFHFPGEETEE